MATKTFEVVIPGHKPGNTPDNVAVGKILDNVLKQNFMGKKVVVRCVGSQDHPSLSLDELTNIVVKTGTDKYDNARMGVGYEDFIKKGKHIDFYGEDVVINEKTKIMTEAIYEMHHSAIGDRGYGVHVDLVLVYDFGKLDMVMNLYEHHATSDGFVFKDPTNKQDALLGIIKVHE